MDRPLFLRRNTSKSNTSNCSGILSTGTSGGGGGFGGSQDNTRNQTGSGTTTNHRQHFMSTTPPTARRSSCSSNASSRSQHSASYLPWRRGSAPTHSHSIYLNRTYSAPELERNNASQIDEGQEHFESLCRIRAVEREEAKRRIKQRLEELERPSWTSHSSSIPLDGPPDPWLPLSTSQRFQTSSSSSSSSSTAATASSISTTSTSYQIPMTSSLSNSSLTEPVPSSPSFTVETVNNVPLRFACQLRRIELEQTQQALSDQLEQIEEEERSEQNLFFLPSVSISSSGTSISSDVTTASTAKGNDLNETYRCAQPVIDRLIPVMVMDCCPYYKVATYVDPFQREPASSCFASHISSLQPTHFSSPFSPPLVPSSLPHHFKNNKTSNTPIRSTFEPFQKPISQPLPPPRGKVINPDSSSPSKSILLHHVNSHTKSQMGGQRLLKSLESIKPK